MKACSLYNLGDLRLIELEEKPLEADEVRIKIKASGICGSDIPRAFDKGTYQFPTVMGHEFSGAVVDAGKDVSRSLIGKKAAVFPLLPCFKCPSCQVGEYASCSDYDYYGSRRDGGFAEYLNVKVWNLIPVPEAVSYEEAAMCEPCAVALHALDQISIDLGDNVLISGAGTIGLLLGKIASAWGAGKVILMDIDERKLEFARKEGFQYTLNSRQENLREQIAEITKGRGVQAAVEGAGVSASLKNCLELLNPFARLVLMGNPGEDICLKKEDYWNILRKQLVVRGTWNSSYNDIKNDWKRVIEAMETKRISVTGLITHKYKLADCAQAFGMIRERKEFAVKVMFIND